MATNEDNQIWTAAIASGKIADNFTWWGYAEIRYSGDASSFSQRLFGVGAGYEIPGGTSVYAGYLHTNTQLPGNRSSKEHRLWQQAAYVIPAGIPNVRVVGRTLFEQRVFERFDDVGLRVGQHVRGLVPVTRLGRLRLLVSGDAFVNLNSTDWGASRGLEQLRGFAGFSIGVGGQSSLEIGFQRQWLLRREAPDSVNNIAVAQLILRF